MYTIMITGATDGIGLETAKNLARLGHHLILHGRNPNRLDEARRAVDAQRDGAVIATEIADLSDFAAIEALGSAVIDHDIDVLITNAGVYHTNDPVTADGLDVRFAVNTIAPYLLTRRLLDRLLADGRIVNLSSAAQAPVDLEALAGRRRLDHGAAYAQSKLALTMWTKHVADQLGRSAPVVVAVNPGSLLATKMVKDGFGVAGNDIGIGVDVLTRAATDDEFADATGRYYDNDSHRFASPHPDALDPDKNAASSRRSKPCSQAEGGVNRRPGCPVDRGPDVAFERLHLGPLSGGWARQVPLGSHGPQKRLEPDPSVRLGDLVAGGRI